MNIRNYSHQDYTQIVTILREADLFDEVWDSETNLKSLVANNPQFILVAEEDNIIIGNIFIVPYGKNVSYLFRLAVKKEFRKSGIGSALINRAEEVIKQEKSTEVGLYVDSGNINLQNFYKKRGFSISQKTYYYMWKEL
jgi:ribosomal protein S18 acetylase RimI-like enzyme